MRIDAATAGVPPTWWPRSGRPPTGPRPAATTSGGRPSANSAAH